MATKPLTKALHTVRVVERIALHLEAASEGSYSAHELLREVLLVLGNASPMDSDPALFTACYRVCAKVLS